MKAFVRFSLVYSLAIAFDNDSQILEDLYDSDGWSLVYTKDNGVQVYNKKNDRMSLNSVKVTYTDTVDIKILAGAIMNGDRHAEFMKKSHLSESRVLSFVGDSVWTYQYLDLPIISDRHYVSLNVLTEISSGTHYRMNWRMLSDGSKGFKGEEINKKPHAVHVVDGVGGWEIKSLGNNVTEVTYRIVIDPGGWIPNFLVNQSNKALAPDTIMSMVQEAKRRESLQ